MTTDVDNYMFGSVLAMSDQDVMLSVILSVAVLVLFVRFYHQLFAVTFDESFSRATGLHVDRYNTLLAVLTALTIVLGMRMMGARLISSLVIFPALTAMRLIQEFPGRHSLRRGDRSGVLLCGTADFLCLVHPGGCHSGGSGPGAVSALLRCGICAPEINPGADGINLVPFAPNLRKKWDKGGKNFSFLL